MMPSRRCWAVSLLVAACAPAGRSLEAQRGSRADEWPQPPLLRAVASWMSLDAPPGHESEATDAIRSTFPDWRRDATGNLLLRRGSGRPRRVVACGLDLPAYVVSRLTTDGRLLLHAVGDTGAAETLRPGTVARVLGRRGAVRGLVAEPAPGDGTPRLEPGARTMAELASLGVALLDPVVAARSPWIFGGTIAGSGVGARAACVAVATAAQRTPRRGETIFIVSVRSTLGWDGLGEALASIGRVDTLIVVDRAVAGAVDARAALGLDRGAADALVTVAPARSAHGATETMSELDVGVLLSEVARRAAVPLDLVTGSGRSDGAGGGVTCEVSLTSPSVASLPPGTSQPDVPVEGGRAVVLARLVPLLDAIGVTGREGVARDAWLSALPAWARERARVDAAGNLVLAAGASRDTLLIVASITEPGFEVTRIARDGTVTLRPLGGARAFAYIGAHARLHIPRAPPTRLRGTCILDRASVLRALDGVFTGATSRPFATASFGMDSSMLARFGVAAGDMVTAAGPRTLFADGRLASRGVAGSAPAAALLLALERLDPAALTRTLVVAIPATRGAAGHDASSFAGVQRVHALGTIAADEGSATPQLGAGVSIRALDDATVVAPAELRRVLAVARAAGVPAQTSVAMGTNAGVPFTRGGARLVPLDLPVRYESGPMPVVDLDDIEAMARLLEALVRSP